ncbi:uncharacterized protein [Pocillopora verrucosa]|uniref:uncharacterized protein n=1 Tax=Pocillopora verrucosa TaxID=203993 RepID=UPI00334001E9
MSFKEPQGQVARWLGRLQYDSEIRRHPGRLHNNADALSRRPRRPHGNCPSCTPTGLSQVTVVARDLPIGETPREVRNCWYSLCTWAEVFAMSNQRATTSAKVIVRNWICRSGVCLTAFIAIKAVISSQEHSRKCAKSAQTLRSMLKARVEDNPATRDEHLDFCLMAYRSSVHSSTGHNPSELMFGREMRIPLDVMVGGAEDNECSYTDFVAVEQVAQVAEYLTA